MLPLVQRATARDTGCRGRSLPAKYNYKFSPSLWEGGRGMGQKICAKKPAVGFPQTKAPSHLMNLHPNKEAAKEWGCGGRNFGAPDGPLPREGVNLCKANPLWVSLHKVIAP